MCHRKVISGDRECLSHHPPLSLNNAYVKNSKREKVSSKISDRPPGKGHLACCCCQAAQRRRGTHRRQPRQPPGSATQCQDEEDEEQQQHQHHPTNHLAVQHNVNKKNDNTKDNKPPANQEYIT